MILLGLEFFCIPPNKKKYLKKGETFFKNLDYKLAVKFFTADFLSKFQKQVSVFLGIFLIWGKGGGDKKTFPG